MCFTDGNTSEVEIMFTEFKAQNMFQSVSESTVGTDLPKHSESKGANTYQTFMSSGKKSKLLVVCKYL